MVQAEVYGDHMDGTGSGPGQGWSACPIPRRWTGIWPSPESTCQKYYKKFRPAGPDRAVEKLAGPADRERFQILLAHSPLFFDAYSRWGADLTLAGHFTGEPSVCPFWGGDDAPVSVFPALLRGEFERDGRKMIVSRGLGTHSIPIRFNNKPQLVVVHLKKKLHFDKWDVYRGESLLYCRALRPGRGKG